MDIFLEPQRGSPFIITVDFFDNVLDVKKKIEEHKGIAVSQQILVFNGQVLQDEQEIVKCELMHHSQVQLLNASDSDMPQGLGPSSMDIMFQPVDDDDPFTIRVGYFDSVLETKVKIEKFTGISVSKLTLLFDGQILEDDHKIAKYTLLPNSQVELVVASDYVPSDIYPFGIDIVVEPMNGNPFTIKVAFYATVMEVKEKLEKDHGILVSKQTLFFNGQVLQDEHYIEECGVHHDSHVQLLVASEQSSPSEKILLRIKLPYYEILFPYEMYMNDTILQLKERMQENKVIPCTFLIVQSSDRELEDHQSLRECGLMNNDVLHIFVRRAPKIHLKINFPSLNSLVSLDMYTSDTVLRLKEKITEKSTFPVSFLMVQSRGRELQDHQSFHDCGLMDNDVIVVNVRPLPTAGAEKIHLMIKLPTFDTLIPMDMHMNDTVLQLKEKIQKNKPIPGVFLMAHSNGIELKDHLSFRECGLMDNAVLHVNVRPFPIDRENGSMMGPPLQSPPLTAREQGMIEPPTTAKGKEKMGPLQTPMTTGPENLMLLVLSRCGTKKITVEVKASNKVKELRKAVESARQIFQFPLPEEGYFFIHRQRVMDENQSFRWNQVQQGDTIEVFPGRVAGRSSFFKDASKK